MPGDGGQSLRSFGNIANATSEGLAAAERIYEVLDEKPSIVDRPGARPLAIASGSIAFDNVSLRLPGGRRQAPPCATFSLTVPGGATVALVGRSGAGKSTVINLVARLFDVETGRILIDGQDLRDVTLASLRDADRHREPGDHAVRRHHRAPTSRWAGSGAGEEEIVAAAKAAAAHEFIVAQPEGYATMIGEGGLKLSGGQRQRLALARAILKDAPILLLDEATSALDTESERLVQEALARFTRNRTTLVIAHRLSTVQRADLICLMEDGRLAETGTHARAAGPQRRLRSAVPLADPPRSRRSRADGGDADRRRVRVQASDLASALTFDITERRWSPLQRTSANWVANAPRAGEGGSRVEACRQRCRSQGLRRVDPTRR